MKKLIIYTLPNCEHCKELKDSLTLQNVKFEEKLFDSEVQTECIMENIFDNSPIIRLDGKLISPEKMIDMIKSFADWLNQIGVVLY